MKKRMTAKKLEKQCAELWQNARRTHMERVKAIIQRGGVALADAEPDSYMLAKAVTASAFRYDAWNNEPIYPPHKSMSRKLDSV